MPAPVITALSSSSLLVQWQQPERNEINGIVVVYKLIQLFYSDLEVTPFNPPTYGVVSCRSIAFLHVSPVAKTPTVIHDL